MKRNYNYILVFILIMCFTTVSKAEGNSVVLSEKLTTVEDEAFLGDVSLKSIVIPKTVEVIGSRAFAGCTSLSEIYLGNNESIQIAKDAFDGCGKLHFYVYSETAGELYALSHGYECDLIEEGNSFHARVLELVTSHGGTASVLQSSDFSTMRLIVRMNDPHLPDISAFDPTEIVRDGDNIFFIQFSTVEKTIECYSFLRNSPGEIFTVVDFSTEILDSVSSAGIVDEGKWDTSDPMGFEDYAPFVAENGQGKATVAVIDSGITRKQEYQAVLREDGINLTEDPGSWDIDKQVHGSMIAGIIRDCIGNANVDILPIKVVSSNGVANISMIGVGIKYAIEHEANIINFSLNFEENDYVTYWLEKAKEAGIKVIVAAGNSSKDIARVYPANVIGVDTISGINQEYERSATSNYGENISYCAPDTYVISTAFPGVTRRGTSFAAPMLSSAFALLTLDPYHNLTDLIRTCRDLGSTGKDNYYGYGMPQLDELVGIGINSIQIDSEFPEEMLQREKHELHWLILPENATKRDVDVKSTNSGILSVEQDDTDRFWVSAVSPGTAELVITAKDHEDISSSITVTVVRPDMTGDIVIDEDHFPDQYFRNRVGNYFDSDGDGILSAVEAEAVTEIKINNYNCKSLEGIQYFSELKTLDCDSCHLTSLDASQNKALTKLICRSNGACFVKLDISGCNELEHLDCDGNGLIQLNIESSTALKYLSCERNHLSELNVTKNTELTNLNCYSNDLSELDITKNTELIYLNCEGNKLSELNVTNCEALTEFYCGHNNLQELIVSHNTGLTRLECDGNQLDELDIRSNSSLQYLECSSNRLHDLNVDDASALRILYCDSNELLELDVHNNSALKYLSCKNNNVIQIHVNDNLESLYCDNNDLGELDVSKNINLGYLSCSNNSLNNLDLSLNRYLWELDCSNNKISSLKLNGILLELNCSNNNLESLDLSNVTALQKMYCYNNEIETLDVSNNTRLETLSCSNNKISELNVESNKSLKQLYCGGNNLSSLDVSNINLQSLDCKNNRSFIFSSVGTIELTSLPGNFDVNKASNWSSGSLDGSILSIDHSCEVSYSYDLGNGTKESFYLLIELSPEAISKSLVFLSVNHEVTHNDFEGFIWYFTYGEPYGDLPVPEWENHTFKGWYTTKGKGGTKITEETIYQGESSLYAHWD